MRFGLMQLDKDDKYRLYRYRRFKQLVLTRVAQMKRINFLKWMRQTKKLSVLEYNEELEGPVNLDAWKWRRLLMIY